MHKDPLSRVKLRCGVVDRVYCSLGIYGILVYGSRASECTTFRYSSRAVSVALQEPIFDAHGADRPFGNVISMACS